LNSEFDLEEFYDLGSDNANFNFQVGIGLVFNRFDIDIRWEKGITSSESVFVTDINSATVTFDTTANLLVLTATYRFNLNSKR